MHDTLEHAARRPYTDDDGTWLPIPEDGVQWDRREGTLLVGGDPVASTSTHYLASPA